MTRIQTTTGPLLTVRGLRVDRGGTNVLDNISLGLEDGEFVSVIGPSGCGKSTLLSALMGDVTPGAGTVGLRGDAGNGVPGLAWMPQSDSLLPWLNALDNATLGLEVAGVPKQEAQGRVRPLLEPFGLAGHADAWPNELSGGMRQRVALLRTVALERPLLLLDEPFGALDALTRSQMQDWLTGVQQRFGWSVLLVTHDVREAVILSDRVLVMTNQPATIAAEIAIPLQRPRSSTMVADPACAELEGRVLAALGASLP